MRWSPAPPPPAPRPRRSPGSPPRSRSAPPPAPPPRAPSPTPPAPPRPSCSRASPARSAPPSRSCAPARSPPTPSRRSPPARPLVMARLFTIGYERLLPPELVNELRVAGVERLIDVRYRPQSRRPGMSKTRLGELLAEHGIAYEHRKALGTPPESAGSSRTSARP